MVLVCSDLQFIFELYGPGGTAYVVLMEGSKKATCRLDLNGLVKKELAKVRLGVAVIELLGDEMTSCLHAS